MGKRKLLLGLVLLLLGAGAAALLLRPSAPDPMGSVGLITQPTALYSVYLDFEENAWTQEDRQFQAGQLSLALDCTAEVLDPDLTTQDLPRLALRLALRSYADKLACQRVLELLAPQPDRPEKKKK